MDFNSFLVRFGLDPEQFSPDSVIAESDTGFAYFAKELRDPEPRCPRCHGREAEVHSHYVRKLSMSVGIGATDVMRIRRIVYICRGCGKTFTKPLTGVASRRIASVMKSNEVAMEFMTKQTFADIAKRAGLSESRVIRLFDEMFRFVKRRPMPRVLCIDEFHFSSQFDQKYCCHLLDFEAGRTVDIVRSRQKAYLEAYFSAIPEGERRRVEYFCSDMYDEYAAVCRRFFPNARHVVDHFHVEKLFTDAISVIRARAMRSFGPGTIEYRFAKRNWKLFNGPWSSIPCKCMRDAEEGGSYTYFELMKIVLSEAPELSEAYEAHQNLLAHRFGCDTYSDSIRFVTWLEGKALGCRAQEMRKVAASLRKWKNEIASAMYRNPDGILITNGKMEAMNNNVKDVIKVAHGYSNFERFRKRCLLILWAAERR